MSSNAQSAAGLMPLLEECGYIGTRLEQNFKLGSRTIPLVGFATKPWDFDSACIAVVDGNGQPEAAVRGCRGLGAPVVWVRHNGTVDWWKQHGTTPILFESRPLQEFPALVRQHREELGPASIYRGKTIDRVIKSRQLEFVDAGLLPLLREEAGKKLHDLVEDMISTTLRGLGQSNPGRVMIREVFIAVFRMLAGKILKDKGVHGFKGLDLSNPADVLSAVARHYSARQTTRLQGKWKTALRSAASLFSEAGSFGVVSPETLAYVYEHMLVTKALRKKLGIHATPPWLVDYMVWQLYDWIREIPVEDRHVFEPASGHAPFLVPAMRLLRLEMPDQPATNIHDYLKKHIHGVEVDDFALEIARLSLTLADIPNPNGWDLKSGDMYASDILEQEATKCRILLSNPPYEKFDVDESRRYQTAGYEVRHKKAVELLHRTLGFLQPGSVFGVVVPQTVVSGPEAKTIREELLNKFEIAEVCLFPGKVFEFAEIETAIILGRRRKEGQNVGAHRTRLCAVAEQGMSAFQHNYSTHMNIQTSQSRLSENQGLELKVSALDEVWLLLKGNKRLRDVAGVGRGIEFKGKKERHNVPVVVPKPKAGYPAGYAGVSRDQVIFASPPEVGIAVHPELIGNPRQGMSNGKQQPLINMGRTARSPWRIKAMLDAHGRPVKNNFVVIRPKSVEIKPLYLWAILNSPIASAYVASQTMRRHNYESFVGDVPLPRATNAAIQEIVRLAESYRRIALARAELVGQQETIKPWLFDRTVEAPAGPTESDVREALLALDAAVLRLYGLPARLERQLLDYFRGHERRGVGCVFGDYFPANFESLVPLYKYISASYRNSTIDAVAERIKPSDTSVATTALRAASRAFGGDE